MGSDRKMDGWVGRTLDGQFRILGPLGRGGMGTVYLAEQVTIGRKVVVKILNQRLSDDATAVERFRREAKAIARLSHPNLIQVYMFGTTPEGAPYIAMEFVPGRPLSEALLIASRLPQKQAVRIAAQIFDAVAHAHATGVIHRDLKPPNIMLCEVTGQTDFVKVLDFGLAKLVGEAKPEATLTKTGCITGTPRYMSPEQARGDPLDARSDIYSLGIILYEMVAGVHPHEAATISDYLICHMSWPPRPFAVSAPGLLVDPELQTFVLKCLAKAPEERYQTAEQAAHVLRQILERLPVGETTASISEIAQMPTADGRTDGGLVAAPLPPGGLPRSSAFTSMPERNSPASMASTVALPPEKNPEKQQATEPQWTEAKPATPNKPMGRGTSPSPSDSITQRPGPGESGRPVRRNALPSWVLLALGAAVAAVVLLALWLTLTFMAGWYTDKTASSPTSPAETLGKPEAPAEAQTPQPVSPAPTPIPTPAPGPENPSGLDGAGEPQPPPPASSLPPGPQPPPPSKEPAESAEVPVTLMLVAPDATDSEDSTSAVDDEAAPLPPDPPADEPQEAPQVDDSAPKPATEVRFGLPPFPGATEASADEEAVVYEIRAPAGDVVTFYKKELARFKGVNIVDGEVADGPFLVAGAIQAGPEVKFQSLILSMAIDDAEKPYVQVFITVRLTNWRF